MRVFAILATFLALAGCVPQKPANKPALSADTLPWTLEEAKQNLEGLTKEKVIELFGKPDDTGGGNSYYYKAPKYLKPDIGSKTDTPTGINLSFRDNYVVGVYRH